MAHRVYRRRPCLGCNAELQPTSGNMRRCASCARKYRVRAFAEQRAARRGGIPGVVICADCGASCPRTAPTQLCCPPCGKERKRESNLEAMRRRRLRLSGTEEQRERSRVHARRRRARLRGSSCEPYKSSDIYDRDGWVCHICTEPMDPAVANPHPLSPSVDHVIPICLGGADSPDNVRAAHMVCNSRRGWRGFLVLDEVTSVA